MHVTPLENAPFSESFDDGLLDVLVGLGLIAIAGSWIAGIIPLGAIAPAVMIPFWKLGRDRLVHPRAPAPAFTAARRAQTQRTLSGWLVFGAGVLLAEIGVFLFARPIGPTAVALQDAIVGVPALLIGLGLLAGLIVGARRFIAYAVLAAAIGVAGAVMRVDEPGWLILAIGVAIFACGAIFLTRFLHRPLIGPFDDHE